MKDVARAQAQRDSHLHRLSVGRDKLQGGAPNMCSKTLPCSEKWPAAGEIFWSCGAERWGLPGVLPSDPFLFVCAVNEIILLFTSLLRLRHPQVHDLVEPALLQVMVE
jgi:hypothetical protein